MLPPPLGRFRCRQDLAGAPHLLRDASEQPWLDGGMQRRSQGVL